ncbi:cobalamin synthase [Clostridium homopropionicum DSM 5847]|uniref:Adenosylcobinamide-GDP ribazoletransferase n=1 Tax=Clostridium homopropionicum DSM 5847 TaxID=1121318 RepID=A0A0L6ZAG6_9CLOT|nr:adenosylcobinamide-GDP ribazoletransferase [Clostridium homopropionicum]KOA19768.1 cobalamin synthase [Clostridium homopropionicum DSM 5847]SFF77945.1 cobalamin-5'-phosphate synthase [Clostridium homopropionicum]
MRKYYYDFLLMLQVLTRVPIKKSLPCENKNFKNGANYFSFIGLLIGLCQFGLFILLSKITAINFAVIAIIIFDALITGAMHIDGFGDTCDGFFAFKGKDKIIEIMKDSRIGTFACIGIVLNLLIKYQGYLFLAVNSKAMSIILISMISRFSMILLSYIGKSAKENGSGNLFINTVTIKEVIVNIAFVLVIGFLLNSIFQTSILLISAVVITILFNSLCNSKIDGITGDSLGANNELVVLLSLMILS